MPTTASGIEYTGRNKALHPIRSPGGATLVLVDDAVPLASLNEIGDIFNLVPLPAGAVIGAIIIDHGDGDTGTGTLRADLEIFEDGVATDLFTDASGEFAAAGQEIILPNYKISETADGKADLRLIVTAAANVAANLTMKLAIFLTGVQAE